MSVYVDPLFPCPTSKQWRWPESCHLIADNLDELHAFAGKIGLKRAWFQTSNKGMPHYDLNARRRCVALHQGAVELTRNEFVALVRKHREAKAA